MKFLEFIKKEHDQCEKYLQNNNAFDIFPKDIEDKTIDCYENLSVIYKYNSDQEKSMKMFQHLTKFGYQIYKSKLFVGMEEGKESPRILCSAGKEQLRNGAQFNLAQTDPKKAIQLFEWAAENCHLPPEYIEEETKAENYDDIAVGHLWRGYALLNLGKYEEAHELLVQVVPYLNKYKKLGIEMWRKVEYALPKALVPLCEYKLDPTQETLQKAQSGIEDYIKSLRENKHKLEGYLYYFHLKEAFPDIYNADKTLELPAGASPKIKKPGKKMILPPDEYDTKGSVIVFDMESGSLEVFGTNNELEEYVEKIKILGNYPVLSGLMELYVTEGQQEPEPLIKECKMLLLRTSIDAVLKEKTELILAVAKDAKDENSTVMLYFDPEVE
jgi:tetratricopeptide (TPR) repeat protein